MPANILNLPAFTVQRVEEADEQIVERTRELIASAREQSSQD